MGGRYSVSSHNVGLLMSSGDAIIMCMYVCMWLNWLECAVGDWQHPGPSEFKCGRATYISFPWARN